MNYPKALSIVVVPVEAVASIDAMMFRLEWTSPFLQRQEGFLLIFVNRAQHLYHIGVGYVVSIFIVDKHDRFLLHNALSSEEIVYVKSAESFP